MKFTYTSKGTYAEIPQTNPLRWAICSQTKDGNFVNESSWLKCKDFFNDYVVAYNGGTRFAIYGFDTTKMTIPAKGTPAFFAVKYLSTAFENNLKQFNLWLFHNKHPQITSVDVEEGVKILLIDPFYLKSTYNMSLFALIIRLCNEATKFDSFEDMMKHKGFPQEDQNKWNLLMKKGKMFNIPEHLQDYLWYCGKDHNSKSKDVPVYQLSSLVHNNGVMSYMNHF